MIHDTLTRRTSVEMESSKLLTLDNPVVKDFLFYAAVVILRMIVLGPLTSFIRTQKGVRDKNLSSSFRSCFKFGSATRFTKTRENDLQYID